MEVLKRGEIRKPILGKETVDVSELGGAVVVRGMTLTERLLLADAESDEEKFSGIARALAWCVLAEDGKAVMSQGDWEVFGSTQFEPCIRLFRVAKRLSLFSQEDIEKKSASTPS